MRVTHALLGKKSAIWIAYIVFALLIIGPLLTRGYVLTLDLVFTPQLRMPTHLGNDYLFQVLLHWLNYMLPADVIEKLLLFVIFLLAGTGMHRLVEYIEGRGGTRAFVQTGAYVAGIFYTINPFTYDRLMAGQIMVLLGYALLPWFMQALLVWLRNPGWKHTIILSAWAVGLSIALIHSMVPMLILAASGMLLQLWRNRAHRTHLWQLIRFSLVILGIFLVASSYWLIPLILGKGSTSRTIASFTTGDQAAFATVGGTAFGRIANIIGLQGFWAEKHNLYLLPQDVVKTWPLLMLVLFALVGLGVVAWLRQGRRGELVYWTSFILASIVLAAGIGTGWLASHVPLFGGYREPQKFAMLVALGYSVFAGIGASTIVHSVKRQYHSEWVSRLAAIVLVLVPCALTAVMFWGAHSQLQVRHYPAEWYTVNNLLNHDSTAFTTLFLPWHQYMYFGLADRIIASPAPQFFDKPIVVSDNPELAGAALGSTSTVERQLDHVLAVAGHSNHQLGDALAHLNIKYIILTKDDDFVRYTYLNQQNNITPVGQYATLVLYRNNAYRSR